MASEIDMLVAAGYDLIAEYSSSSGTPISYVGSQAYFDNQGVDDVLGGTPFVSVRSGTYYQTKFSGIIKGIINKLQFSRVWNIYQPVLDDLGKQFNQVRNNDFSFVQSRVEDIHNEVIKIVDHVEEEVTSDTTDMLDQTVKMGNDIIDYTNSKVDGVSEKIDASQGVITEYIDEKINSLKSSIKDTTENVINFTNSRISEIETSTKNSIDKMSAAFSARVDQVSQSIEATKTGLTGMVTSAISGVTGYVKESIGAVKDTLQISLNAVYETIKGIKDDIVALSKPLFSARDKLINYFIRIIVESFESMTSSIPDIEI